MTMWHSKLAVVLDNFLSSRKGKPDLHFWYTAALDWGDGYFITIESSPRYLTGWITTFSLFDSNGYVVGYVVPPGDRFEEEKRRMGQTWGWKNVMEKWWYLDTKDIADNVISVPITVNDNSVAYSTRMYIGQLMSEFEEGLDREGNEKEMLERQGINGTKNVLTPRTDYALVVQGLQADVDRLKG